LQTFFDGPVWRYAAGLAGTAVIGRSAYLSWADKRGLLIRDC
jgi:hypothetical protein